MSILLDAVTKSKRKHNEFADPALPPGRQYDRLHQKSTLAVKIGIFVLAAVIAVITARWASEGGETQHPVVSRTQNKPAPEVKQPVGVQPAPVKAGDVELAGKSALPIAQVYTAAKARATASQVSGVEPVQLASQPEPRSASAAQPETRGSLTQNADESRQPPIILVRRPTENEMAIIQAETDTKSASNVPATALTEKQQRQLSLEALKRQIAAAASDVGLKTKEQQKQDQLVKEIDNELRKTEHQKSVRSSDKNDPMMRDLPKTKYPDVPSYGELPAGVQLQVPEFNISAHMYSTVPSQRRLSVNGRELKEGDKIKGKLKILEIRPRDVVLEVAGEKFKVPAI